VLRPADRQLLIACHDLDSTRADAARAAVHSFRALGGGWARSRSGRQLYSRLPGRAFHGVLVTASLVSGD
jgi:hypothetical protein